MSATVVCGQVDTPFPYPYAQAVLMMLVMWMLFVPFFVCEIVNSLWFAIIVTFLAVFAFALLNEVAYDPPPPQPRSARATIPPLHLSSMIYASMIRECLLRRRDLEDPFGHATNQVTSMPD